MNLCKKISKFLCSAIGYNSLVPGNTGRTKNEELYNSLPAPVKSGRFGMYITQLIQESKINPIGSTLLIFRKQILRAIQLIFLLFVANMC